MSPNSSERMMSWFRGQGLYMFRAGDKEMPYFMLTLLVVKN